MKFTGYESLNRIVLRTMQNVWVIAAIAIYDCNVISLAFRLLMENVIWKYNINKKISPQSAQKPQRSS